MMKLSKVPGRNIRHKNVEYLHFSGTSYLGMVQDACFTEKLKEGLSSYGNNFGSSRNGNLQIDVYEQLENNLAKMLDLPFVVCASSGTLAARIIMEVLQKDVQWHYASNTHPALLSENAHSQDFNNWMNTLELTSGLNAICFNAVDPLNLEPQDFSLLKRFEKDDRIFIIDDSHGIGVLGPKGQGISYTMHDHGFKNLLIYGSMAKALGVDAGFIATDNERIFQQIKAAPVFAGASPMAPAFAYAFNQSMDYYPTKLQSLRENLAYFESKMRHKRHFNFLPSFPVFRCLHPDIAQKLLAEKIIISSFSYPYPEDPPISRIIINALHSREDLDVLLRSLDEILS